MDAESTGSFYGLIGNAVCRHLKILLLLLCVHSVDPNVRICCASVGHHIYDDDIERTVCGHHVSLFCWFVRLLVYLFSSPCIFAFLHSCIFLILAIESPVHIFILATYFCIFGWFSDFHQHSVGVELGRYMKKKLVHTTVTAVLFIIY